MADLLGMVATLASALFAGAALYVSLVEHPARLSCGTETAYREWAPSYKRGTVMQASLAVLAAATGTARYLFGGGVWLLGAALIFSVVPFTLIIIFPTNRRLLESGRDPASVLHHVRRLVDTGGALEVGTVAREVEWSRRHLSERFRLEYGLAPKVIAQVVRFERARRLLASRSRPSLAHVAAVCGYADQSHLTRDWRRFAGKSPTAWLTEELPFVQDDAAEPASQ